MLLVIGMLETIPGQSFHDWLRLVYGSWGERIRASPDPAYTKVLVAC
jgi:hypothetical protein